MYFYRFAVNNVAQIRRKIKRGACGGYCAAPVELRQRRIDQRQCISTNRCWRLCDADNTSKVTRSNCSAAATETTLSTWVASRRTMATKSDVCVRVCVCGRRQNKQDNRSQRRRRRAVAMPRSNRRWS